MKLYDTKRKKIENFVVDKTIRFGSNEDGDYIMVLYDDGYGYTMEKFFTIERFYNRFKDVII